MLFLERTSPNERYQASMFLYGYQNGTILYAWNVASRSHAGTSLVVRHAGTLPMADLTKTKTRPGETCTETTWSKFRVNH